MHLTHDVKLALGEHRLRHSTPQPPITELPLGIAAFDLALSVSDEMVAADWYQRSGIPFSDWILYDLAICEAARCWNLQSALDREDFDYFLSLAQRLCGRIYSSAVLRDRDLVCREPRLWQTRQWGRQALDLDAYRFLLPGDAPHPAPHPAPVVSPVPPRRPPAPPPPTVKPSAPPPPVSAPAASRTSPASAPAATPASSPVRTSPTPTSASTPASALASTPLTPSSVEATEEGAKGGAVHTTTHFNRETRATFVTVPAWAKARRPESEPDSTKPPHDE